MTRKFLITAAAITAVNGMALAQMSQSPTAQQQQQQGQQGQQSTQMPSAQPSGASMQGQGQQQQLTSQEFVKQAAAGGQYEVKSAKLIQDKVDDQQVKQHAQHIEQDHQKANDELKQIAKAQNITVSDDMDAKHQRMYDQLKEQDEEQMAQTWKQQQIQAHKDTIELFQRASTQLQDPQLKQFAQKQLPILQQHLTMIQGADQSAQPAGSTLNPPQQQPKNQYQSPMQPQNR